MTRTGFYNPFIAFILQRTMHTLVGAKVAVAVRHVPLIFTDNKVENYPPNFLPKKISKDKIYIKLSLRLLSLTLALTSCN